MSFNKLYKNSYSFLSIKLLLFTEVSLFLTLLSVCFYFLSNPLNCLDIVNSNVECCKILIEDYSPFMLILLLSLFLFEIRLVILSFYAVFILFNFNYALKSSSFLVLILSFLFLLLQSLELFYMPTSFIDTNSSMALLFIIGSHYFHVFIGFVFSLLLIINV